MYRRQEITFAAVYPQGTRTVLFDGFTFPPEGTFITGRAGQAGGGSRRGRQAGVVEG